jgi:hypothetical protein
MSDRLTVADLLRDIDNREFILPEFQRGYVWTNKQVKEYLQSLYKKYPTGNFLIWKTPHLQKARGGSGNEDNKYYQLILDGQQRLTSLYALFKGTPPPFYEGEALWFDLYFNIDTEEFVYYMEKRMKNNPEWIGVTEFFKVGDAAKYVNDAPSDDLKQYYLKNLTKLTKLNDIRNYTYDIQKITELDIDEVVTVFNLVNSSGTPLSKADLGLAHVCSFWPEARDVFKTAQRNFKKHNFEIDLDIITTCISAVAVDSVLFERSFYEADRTLIEESWNKVERLLEYVINVLKNDAYIDSTDDLRTPYVLIPLIYYLSRNRGIFDNVQDKNMALYWFYQALLWGRYSGQTPTKLQADIINLKNTNSFKSLIEYLKRWRGGNLAIEAEDLELQGTPSRFYPLTYIVARSKGAIDWFNGMKLFSKNIGVHYKIENHHIFPQAVLYNSGYSSSNSMDKRKVNEIANIAFLTKETNLKISKSDPLKYLKDIEQQYPNALKSQFMPKEEYLRDVKRYEDFLTERRQIIAKEINRFMDKLITDEELLTPPTSMDLIKNGENEMVELKSCLRWSVSKSQVDKDIEFNIMRTLCAFLNYNGGILFIGIDDQGNILGLENDLSSLGKNNIDGFQLHFTNLIEKYLGREFVKYIHVSFEQLEGKTICKVQIEHSKQPVFIKSNGDKYFYTRIGNSSKALDIEDTTKYIHLHWN